MTLKSSLTCRQVPRSSVGRVSDRTMLRSVVTVQSLARGTCHFCLSFFFIFFIFSFFTSYPSPSRNKALMSVVVDTHIIYHQIGYILLLNASN